MSFFSGVKININLYFIKLNLIKIKI